MTDQAIGAKGPEREVAIDMARLGVMIAPGFLLLSVLFWGSAGLASSALALGLVIGNLLIGAWIIGQAAAISPNVLMGAVLGGFLVRLIALALIVVPIRNADWFEVAPFGLTLVGGHLALLAWESQRVSASLAYPGLPPSKRPSFPIVPTRSKSE